MKDQTIVCENCKNQFVFSVGEQQFYASKGLPAPIYCPICKAIKQQESLRPKKPQN
jgi:hypothetical protein